MFLKWPNEASGFTLCVTYYEGEGNDGKLVATLTACVIANPAVRCHPTPARNSRIRYFVFRHNVMKR